MAENTKPEPQTAREALSGAAEEMEWLLGLLNGVRSNAQHAASFPHTEPQWGEAASAQYVNSKLREALIHMGVLNENG